MDTENFVLKRREILERLDHRRQKDLSEYPFQLARDFGVQLPSWLRLALTFVGQGGLASRLLEIGLPLALPFIMKSKAKAPTFKSMFQQLFASKS